MSQSKLTYQPIEECSGAFLDSNSINTTFLRGTSIDNEDGSTNLFDGSGTNASDNTDDNIDSFGCDNNNKSGTNTNDNDDGNVNGNGNAEKEEVL